MIVWTLCCWQNETKENSSFLLICFLWPTNNIPIINYLNSHPKEAFLSRMRICRCTMLTVHRWLMIFVYSGYFHRVCADVFSVAWREIFVWETIDAKAFALHFLPITRVRGTCTVIFYLFHKRFSKLNNFDPLSKACIAIKVDLLFKSLCENWVRL